LDEAEKKGVEKWNEEGRSSLLREWERWGAKLRMGAEQAHRRVVYYLLSIIILLDIFFGLSDLPRSTNLLAGGPE
jgi:hypothetical protein